ncbi:MAG: hypothetical protein ABSA94_19870 [Acidobacteriaceae bacterium]
MNFDLFLAPSDADRAARTLSHLSRHDLTRFALTGGFAIELHVSALQIQTRGGQPTLRPLHDIDFLVDSFRDLPPSLGVELLLRHIHPHDPPAKTLLQGVDPTTSVRVDVFRAYGNELDRAQPVTLAGISLRIVSLQDLTARHTRLCWDLVEGKPLAPKYARDFLRLLALIPENQFTGSIDAIWQEHRKPHFAGAFAEAAQQIRRAIEARPDLLIPPSYSTDIHEVCERCQATPAFPLTPPSQILAHLGYC